MFGLVDEQSALEIDEHDQIVTPSELFSFCMSSNDIICLPKEFMPIGRDILSLGFVSGDVHLMGRIRNTSGISRMFKLEMANPSLDKVAVTVVREGKEVHKEIFGDTRKFSERSFFHRNFIVSINLDPGETATITIKIDQQREAIFLPFRIVSEDHFLKTRAKDYMLLGGIIGMYSIYILFVLGLFLLARNRLFLFYALLDVFVLLYCLLDTGYGFQFVWPSAPFIQQVIIPFTAFAYLLAIISFAREFFSTRIKYPLLDNVFKLYIGLDVLAFLSVIIIYVIIGTPLAVPMAILTILFLLFGVTVTALGVITFFQSGRREGFWFLLLFVLHLVMFGFILNQKGYLGHFIIRPDSPVYIHLPVFTSTPHYIFDVLVAEMMIVSAIIAFRFQYILKEYNVSRLKIEVINRESIKAFVEGQEAERNALADRLHNKVGIDLNGIDHEMGRVCNVFPQSEGLRSSIHQLHSVQKDLRRITSDYVIDWKVIGLTDLVRKVVEQMRIALPELEISIAVEEEVQSYEDNDQVKLNLYRILQEACNNVIRHADARSVSLVMKMRNGGLQVELKDDGIGFDTSDIKAQKGIGLRNMETRARALHGSITYESNIDGGTIIQLHIPWQNGKRS